MSQCGTLGARNFNSSGGIETSSPAQNRTVPGSSPGGPTVIPVHGGRVMIEGGCQCGTLRYAADGEVSDLSHCHCSMCRKLHGAAYVTFAAV